MMMISNVMKSRMRRKQTHKSQTKLIALSFEPVAWEVDTVAPAQNVVKQHLERRHRVFKKALADLWHGLLQHHSFGFCTQILSYMHVAKMKGL